jgi:hypothetical protein
MYVTYCSPKQVSHFRGCMGTAPAPSKFKVDAVGLVIYLFDTPPSRIPGQYWFNLESICGWHAFRDKSYILIHEPQPIRNVNDIVMSLKQVRVD